MTNKVYLAACQDYDKERVESCIRRMFNAFGGVEALLQKGKRVTVKPNLLMAREPEAATTTHPAVVEAVVRLLVEHGASVTIADSPGGPYNDLLMRRVYESSGMAQVAQATGARLNRDYSSRKRHYSGIRERDFDIIEPIAGADVIVNIAKMKTHGMTYFTGAVKNNYGTIPGLTKAAYHSQHPGRGDFAALLVDLCRCVAPEFSIIDGIEGMDGKGPSGGRPRQGGILIGSPNPFAADLAAMHHCGLHPKRAMVHQYGAEQGLVPAAYEGLELCGDQVEPLATPFVPAIRARHNRGFIHYMPKFLKPALERLLVPYPVFTDRCIGCGACVRACPGKALEICQGRAALEKNKCIKCYCCHELCPVKAIDL